MIKQEVISAIHYIKKYKTETNRIEVVKAVGGFPKCYDTISSFSNKYGGLIIFGIDESMDFEITGVYDINDLQKKISSLCNDSMEPAVRPDILPLEYDGKKILAVKIEEIPQNKKPCYYKPKGLKGGSYIRIGDNDLQMTDYEIYALESYNDHIHEDIRPNKRATLDDLNEKALIDYINEIKKERPNFAKNDFNKCLKLSGIIDSNDENIYPTLAGTLIFGEYPQSSYPQLFIACSVIPGTELGDIGTIGERFLDNKRVEGTIEEMLRESLNFIQRNMKTSVIIDSNGQRTNRFEYPLDALKEAITNALIHRDYSSQTENSYISIFMFNDRLEITNPGGLYGINRIEQLGSTTNMEARNTTIIKILEEKGSIIENRHTGIPTMIREMKNYGLPEPEFYEDRNCFKVIFRNKNISQISNEGQSLENKKDKILQYCNDEARTAKEIKEYLKISSRQYLSSFIIKPLIEEGKLDYTNKNSINAKNQKYITVKNNL